VYSFFLDTGDHDAVLELLQAFFHHNPPVFDTHYILRFLSTTVCSQRDGAALKRIIAFSREKNIRHVMFADAPTPPSIMAAKCGNLNAIIALQDDGCFDCLSRDMETGLNAAQFALINGHDHIVQHIMYDIHAALGASWCSSVPRSLPDISDIISNTSSFGDTTLHILVLLYRCLFNFKHPRLTFCGRLGPVYPMTLLRKERCNLSVNKIQIFLHMCIMFLFRLIFYISQGSV
jgi:hypothetical protein